MAFNAFEGWARRDRRHCPKVIRRGESRAIGTVAQEFLEGLFGEDALRQADALTCCAETTPPRKLGKYVAIISTVALPSYVVRCERVWL